ncbi:hypothetical protein R3P38DRAFT_2766632 [Favolaschia claudopus]|uniref:Uncharacterized protein n=1 Tax=Favolaschia claudopus TaxID=2862362 RepID=A0AAW0CYT8_9AGAR
MKPDPIDLSDELLAAAQLKVKEAVEAARASATSSSSAHRVAEARCIALEAELQTLKEARDTQAVEIMNKTDRICHLALEMQEKDNTIIEWAEKYAKLEEEKRGLEEEARDRARLDQERTAVLIETRDSLQRLVDLQPGSNSGTASRSGPANAASSRHKRVLDSDSDDDEPSTRIGGSTRHQLVRQKRIMDSPVDEDEDDQPNTFKGRCIGLRLFPHLLREGSALYYLSIPIHYLLIVASVSSSKLYDPGSPPRLFVSSLQPNQSYRINANIRLALNVSPRQRFEFLTFPS